jgi:hypothetical protein
VGKAEEGDPVGAHGDRPVDVRAHLGRQHGRPR